MHRRRRPNSSTPQSPSTPALIAASAVYRPTSLAAAAAGAALRHASTSPAPPEQRTGSIPTKRMLKRRDSYSSVPSDSDQRPPMQRANSGGLTERRFRGERPAAPTPRAARGKRWSPDSSDADDSEGFGRSVSLRSTASTRSFPITLRSRSLSKKSPKVNPAGLGSRIHRRSSDPDVSRHKPPLASNVIARLSQGDYGDSANSLTTSELESIAEDTTTPKRAPKIPEYPEDEDREDTFEFARKRIGRTRSKLQNTNGKGKQPSTSTASHSPSRTIFSLSTLAITPHKHSPPPRSVSPAKSALKHLPSLSGHSTIPHSEAGSVRKVRVSFSEEDCPALSLSGDTSRKLAFGSLGTIGGVETVPVTAPSLPGSNSEESNTERQALLEEPNTHDEATPANVPELVLIIPTPKEEKPEEDGALSLPGGFPSRSADRYVGVDAVTNGDAPGSDTDTDSLSGESIYSDALEELCSIPVTLGLPWTPDTVPLSAVRPRNGLILANHAPSSSPSSIPPPIPAQHQHHYSSSSSSTISFPSSTASVLSESSFRRISPRQKRTGMMMSLRRAPSPAPIPSDNRMQMQSTLRISAKADSRSGSDSGDYHPFRIEDPVLEPQVGASERGFWRRFLRMKKEGRGRDERGGRDVGDVRRRGVIVKKAKPKPKEEVWAGGAEGIRTVNSGGLLKEVGEEIGRVGSVKIRAGGKLKKKRVGPLLRKMLGLWG